MACSTSKLRPAGVRGFVFDYSGGIYSLARDGAGGTQLLVAADGWDDAPAVNPVNRMVVSHNGRPANPDGGLHLVDADGSNRHRIFNTGVPDLWPDWSADGDWISFEHYAPIHNYFKIRPDGSELTQLTALSENSVDGPAIWAPDGSALFVTAKVDSIEGIYRIPARGAGLPTRIPIKSGPPVHWVGGVVNSVPKTQ